MQISSESSSSYSNYSYSSSGMSGLISGMDTENLVKSMLSGIQTKIDTQNQQKQQLLWKQDMYRDVISKISSFQTKYMDLTSSTSLRTTSFFNKMSTESSSSAVKIVSASSNESQDFSVQVAQLATASKLTSGKFSSGEITMDTNAISTNLNDYFTAPEQSITFTSGESSVSINLCSDDCMVDGSPSLEKMVETINSNLSASNLDINLTIGDENKITIENISDEQSEFSVSGSSNALSTLGLKSMTFNDDNEFKYESTVSADQSKLLAEPPKSATINVSLDGKTKAITIENGSAEDVINSFKTQIKDAFGTSITVSDDGKITARQGQTLSFSGDTELLGIEQGSCTRLTTSSKLSDIGITDYTFKINDTEFEFDADTKISDVISKVNSSDAGAKLVYNSLSDNFTLSSTSTGVGFELNVSGGVAESFFASSSFTSGQNAVVNIDGTTFERTSNSLSYNGVSIELKNTTGDYYTDVLDEGGNVIGKELLMNSNGTLKTESGVADTAANVSAERDVDGLVKTIKGFVEDYNTLISELNELTHASKTYTDYDPLTDEQKKEMSESEVTAWEKKAKEGLLSGDSDISKFLSSMRSTIYSLTSNGTSLSMFGIDSSSEWKDYGKLEIDEDALKKNLTENADAVISTFTSVATDLNNICKSAANTSSASPGSLVSMAGIKGKVSEKNNTINSRLDNIADKIKQLQSVYDTRKERYWNSFNAMENAISNMSSTSSYLTQMLGG